MLFSKHTTEVCLCETDV